MREHTVEDLLAHLVHRVLTDLEVTSMFISTLDSKSQVEMIGQYGIHPEMWTVYPKGASIFDKYPITDALRHRKTIWINTLPDWGDDYPLLKETEFPSTEKTFICMNIEKCDTPVGVLGMFCSPVIQVDAEIDAFLGAIGNLLSLYMYRIIDSAPNMKSIKSKTTIGEFSVVNQKLTERQMLILRMIADNRTNILISELLGYSESTIRQETIKIYAKLGCNGREEAARIYRDRFAESEKVSS